jgi:hypothetical protein
LNVLNKLGELVRVRTPPSDTTTHDRRSCVSLGTPITGRSTRLTTIAKLEPGNPEWTVDESSLEAGRDAADDVSDDGTDDRWSDGSGEVMWGEDSEVDGQEGCGPPYMENEDTLPKVLSRDELPPSAWYLSPGWYGTGMENVSAEKLDP